MTQPIQPVGPEPSEPTGSYGMAYDPGSYEPRPAKGSKWLYPVGIACIGLAGYWVVSWLVQAPFLISRFGLGNLALNIGIMAVQAVIVLTAGILLIRARR